MQHSNQALNGAYVADEVAANNNTINATPTGSTDTAILRMNAAATTVSTLIVETTTAAAGTRVNIQSAGYYLVGFSMVFTGAVNIAAGVSFSASTAGAIVADPVVGVADVIYSVDATSAVNLNTQIEGELVVRVTQANIASATGATFRFHATNSAAGAPVGLVASSAQYRIDKIADLSV